MKLPMSLIGRYLILSAMFLVGCRTAHNVAVTSFRVIDAPANYVRRHIDEPATGTTTPSTTSRSDVKTPGQPMVTTTLPRTTQTQRTVADSGTSVEGTAEPKPRNVSQNATPGPPSPPYAKPVPGKPGYVYSPFDPNGGYVDVTGYASGSKAKDPYSGKIFIVP